MRCGVYVPIYDCPYFDDWYKSMCSQKTHDFTIYTSLELAVEKEPHVIFTNLDDIYDPNYVFAMKGVLLYHDAVGCAARIVENDEEEGIFGFDTDIEKYYAYGYGNVGYRSRLLKKLLPIPDVERKDLWLIKHMLELGASKYFIRKPMITYRRYGQEGSALVKVGDRYIWRVT